MFLCYSVFKTYVIEKYVFLSFRLKSMLLCLQSPCSSVSHKSLTPLGAPLCRRGARGEAVPRKRENQINTLVLKDINFTINIIELSYYRTIDTLNQPKKCSRGTCLPKPLQRRGCPYPYLHTFSCFKLYPIRTSPPLEGLGEASFWGWGFTLLLVHSLLYSPFLSVRGRG